MDRLMSRTSIALTILVIILGFMLGDACITMKDQANEIKGLQQQLNDCRNDLGYCQGTMR
jgi:hypothetical protein